jgi:uncharacterized protein (TIGR00730 family)
MPEPPREITTVCVFAGSAPGTRPAYAQLARELGAAVAARGWTLVYGGGSRGLMGELADAAMVAGGRVIGIIPAALDEREVGHTGISELRVVGSMHERKALMAELSGGFIALPGGLGTIEELIEAATWTQLGLHRKPIALLDAEDYWGPLEAVLDHAVEKGFLRAENRALVRRAGDPEAALDGLRDWPLPAPEPVAGLGDGTPPG